jgi:hypothetical protein
MMKKTIRLIKGDIGFGAGPLVAFGDVIGCCVRKGGGVGV